MTKRQAEALAFIKKFWAQNNYSPSYREIANALGIETSRAYDIVSNLRDRGYVSILRGKARSVTLTESQDG